MKKIIVWLKACRLKLHILGILPVLVGSLIAFNETRNFNLVNLVFAELITISILIATAFANDYADVETDKLNKNFNPFSGGSRLIVEGFISKRKMLIAAAVASSSAIFLSIVFLLFLKGHPIVLALSTIGLLIGTGYSLAPLKINYRGFGEFFVVIMYSIFCLFFGYVTQRSIGFNKEIFYFSIPIGIAMFLIILITEVPDCESDKFSGKMTIPTIFGKEASLNLYFIGVALLYISTLILYLLGAINRVITLGLFSSLPLGAYIGFLSLSREKISAKYIFVLCGATIVLNVWINVVLSLNAVLG